MKKRILALVLSAALCLGVVGTALPRAQAASTEGEAEEAEAVLAGLGILTDYRPAEPLIRAQFCKMAILAEGHGDLAQGSSYRSLFSDVPGGGAATPYINLAYEEGLVSGYGDGTFGPEDPVTLGQAVTAVLTLLGYTQEEIGPFWPEDYMVKAAALGLLDGMDQDSGRSLTQKEGVLLFYRMLGETTSAGADYIETLCETMVEDVVLLSDNAEAEDGTEGQLQVYTREGVVYYEPACEIPDSLVGRRGTLLLDRAGEAAGFLPDESSYQVVSPKKVEADAITGSDGRAYSVPSEVTVLLDEESSTYGMCWYELEDRERITIYYTATGGVDLVVASEKTAYEGVTLTGYYESASPNTVSPTSIGLLGMEFEVEERAQKDLAECKVGERITITLNGAGDVVSAKAAVGQKSALYGVLQSDGIALSCGLTATGEIHTSSAQVGDLVRVSSTGIGTLSASPVSGGSSLSLNLSAGKLGSIPLSEQVAIYERAGKSAVVELETEDIQVDTVPASRIDFYATDESGQVSVLLLDDVTGNAYAYGLLTTGVKAVGAGEEAVTKETVRVENGDGTSQDYETSLDLKSGAMGGIAADGSGEAVAAAELERSGGISRASFDSADTVVIEQVRVPISEEVQVYHVDSGKWTTLSEAKAYADTFTVYYSGTLGLDAVVRIICTE